MSPMDAPERRLSWRALGVVLTAMMLASGCQGGVDTSPGKASTSSPAPAPSSTRNTTTGIATVTTASVSRPLQQQAVRLRGTHTWRPNRRSTAGQIEGYASRSDAPAGVPVELRVSTDAARFRVTAYRLGDYRGGPAHVVWTSTAHRGQRQPGPVFADRTTRTVVARWRTSLTVPTDGWADGFYLFKLRGSNGWQSLVPYVVRSQRVGGKVVLVAPVATWQAYNDWGGYSMYVARSGDHPAWAVSFDRPYPDDSVGEMGFGVLGVAVDAERARVPLAYLTDLDLDADPHALDGARAYVSLGHDEYWSRRMRAAVTRARARGTNVAFFGANTMYWKVRLTGTALRPERLMVGYKTAAALDPFRRSHPRDATGLFRNDPDTGVESSVTGMEYECFPVDAPYRIVSPRWWGFRGTHLTGQTGFQHLVGVEADRVYPTRQTPHPLQVLSDATYSCRGVPTSTQSTYYTTRSGAGVLDVGTLRWTCALAGHCGPLWKPGRRVIAFTRKVTDTVLKVFAVGPAGLRHPAHDNVARFHLPALNQVPAS